MIAGLVVCVVFFLLGVMATIYPQSVKRYGKSTPMTPCLRVIGRVGGIVWMGVGAVGIILFLTHS